MSLRIGIIGLPNVGKSTLFNALANAQIPAANYPFCTIEPNVGVVPIQDKRLEALERIILPKILTGSTVEFVDIAGLVKGASKGEGLGNQFLGHIRQVDAILHVLRCFTDENVASQYPGIDLVRDAEVVETELTLADLQTLENRLDKATRMLKTADPVYKQEISQLEAAINHLNVGQPLRSFSGELPDGLFPLTDKPIMYVANIGENDLGGLSAQTQQQLKDFQAKLSLSQANLITISANLEAEIAQLAPDERQLFQEDLGLTESGLQKVVAAGLELLRLVTFYTIKGQETRSWLVRENTPAPQAAGKIHSDMEQGFIRAEVIAWDKLIELKSFALGREKGLLRVEGRDYLVQDGDVIQFRFNV